MQTHMYFVAHVCDPMFEDERSERKYMRVTLTESGAEAVRRLHMFKRGALRNSIVEDPLMGRVLTVKIPFRYGRVMCKVEGSKPVQSLAVGDRVEADIEYCGTWNLQGRCGYTWKFKSLHT